MIYGQVGHLIFSTGKKLNNAGRTEFIQLVTASLFFAENLFIL